MSVQQNLLALRVPDERTMRRLEAALASPVLRVAGVQAADARGWTVILESHEILAPGLLAAARTCLGDAALHPHTLTVPERAALLVGNDPWAGDARG